MATKQNKPIIDSSLLWIIAIAVILAFASIFFALKPHLVSGFNLATDESSNIGNTIGGITAPILTLLSVALLYLTLKRQTESNDNQRFKNDTDLVFILYNQLESAYREITCASTTTTNSSRHPEGKTTITREKQTHYGFDAFQRLCSIFKDNFAKEFSTKHEASKIMFIIQSYRTLDELIAISQINEELKGIIERKTYNFYISRMRDPLANLCFHIRDNQDEESKEAVEFFVRMEQRRHADFNLHSVLKVQDLFPSV